MFLYSCVEIMVIIQGFIGHIYEYSNIIEYML